MPQKKRHLAKAFTWRACATCVTIVTAIVVTGDTKVGLILGPIDFISKVVLYYLHERIWLRTQFGLTHEDN